MQIRSMILDHAKCLSILFRISECDECIMEAKRNLSRPCFYPESYKKTILKYEAIKERLVESYAGLVMNMTEGLDGKLQRKTCVELAELFYN